MRSGLGGNVAAVLSRAKSLFAAAESRDVASVRAFSLSSGFGRLFKDGEDKVLGVVALLVLLPVMAAIALAIVIESPGPVLYRQRRRGRGGQPFTVYKFRTMQEGSDCAGFRQAVRQDPRVTRVGRILRRSSLDELPQLFNVLNGSMSLIGPRPHPFELDRQFAPLIAGYDRRIEVKPGITGLAQIHGYRGETPDLERMRRRIECDLRYIAEWSPLLDVKILLATPVSCLTTDKAY